MQIEEKYMRRALELARLGDGRVSPNPMVGAVVVARGRIIGEGFHRRYGEAHAEVNAIRSIKPEDEHLISESTIYVTLEPCSHYGKTPPCSKLIIDKQIPRVVVGCKDPFIEVSGRGIRMLRDAGREVAVGILETECREINKKFMTAHTLKRPYIMLKWAESADRFIDSDHPEGEPSIVLSNPVTQSAVHKLRTEFDAIMVGSRTAIIDNPSLTARKWHGHDPLRVVLDRKGALQGHGLKLLSDGKPTLVFTSRGQTGYGTADHIEIPRDPEPLTFICNSLYGKGITSMLVEGGATLLSSFIESGIWDEIRIERTEAILSGGVKAPELPDGTYTTSSLGGNTVLDIKRR